MRGFIGVVVGLAMLVPLTAQAAPFVLMHVTDDIVTFADKASIRREPAMSSVWTYTVPIVDLTDGSGLMASKTEVDCRGERHRDVHTATYNWAGDSITTSTRVGEWQVVVPDTFAGRLLGLVCRGEVLETLAEEGTFLDVARASRAVLKERRKDNR